MTKRNPGPAKPDDAGGKPKGSTPAPASVGWTYFSYMISGMVLYGGIGWLIGRWTHVPVLFPIGMIVGLALAIALIIFRVSRS